MYNYVSGFFKTRNCCRSCRNYSQTRLGITKQIFSSISQEQVATLWSPNHLWGPVCHRCGAEFLTHRLHPASQRKLWPTSDLAGAHRQRHLQVYGHLHHGVCGLHDWHVQPVLLLPGSQVQSCLHHVSKTQLCEWFNVHWEDLCDMSNCLLLKKKCCVHNCQTRQGESQSPGQ